MPIQAAANRLRREIESGNFKRTEEEKKTKATT